MAGSEGIADLRSALGASVKEVMTPALVTLKSEQSLHEAAQIFTDSRISGAPVVDGDRRVVGVLTLKDIAHSLLNLDSAQFGRTHVESVMTPNVTTIGINSSIGDAVNVMARRRIHRVFVVDEKKKIRGVFSTYDLMLWVKSLAGGDSSK